MTIASAPYYFVSYSREDVHLQKRIVAELRSRGINIWVDIENLIPGSPAWEREISFAEQNEKRIFPVLIQGRRTILFHCASPTTSA